jgi:hypothetical protein
VNDIVDGLFFLAFEEYNIFCMSRGFQIQRKRPWSILWSREAYILPPTVNPTRKDLKKDKGLQKKTKHSTHLYLLYPWYFLLTPTHSGLNIIQLYP